MGPWGRLGVAWVVVVKEIDVNMPEKGKYLSDNK